MAEEQVNTVSEPTLPVHLPKKKPQGFFGRLGSALRSVRLWWVGAALAAFVVLSVLWSLMSGADWHVDPSALVPPRQTALYMETRDVGALLADLGGWDVWQIDARQPSMTGAARLLGELAASIRGSVAGLSGTLPRLWLTDAKQAALCMTQAEEGAPAEWAVYLHVPDATGTVASLASEPGLVVNDTPVPGVRRLGGQGPAALFVAAADPWLVVAGGAGLAEYAVKSTQYANATLAGSGLVPGWSRNDSIRGVVLPDALPQTDGILLPLGFLGAHMAPDARLGFTANISYDGVSNVRVYTQRLTTTAAPQSLGGRLFRFVLWIFGIVCALLIIVVLGAAIGLGGWFRLAAMRMGITPREKPVDAEPSDAFAEDAHLNPPAVSGQDPAQEGTDVP